MLRLKKLMEFQLFMKIIKKITIVGSSHGIIINKPIMKLLNLKYEDYVEVSIKKIKKEV